MSEDQERPEGLSDAEYVAHLEEENALLKDENSSIRGKIEALERLVAAGYLGLETAHEFKNRLSIINQALYILTRELGGTQNDKVRRNLTLLTTETEHSARIFKSILGFAKGRLSLSPTSTSLVMADCLERVPRSQGILVDSNLRDVPKIMADSWLLETVFVNLIDNAYQAMGQEGELKVGVDQKEGSVVITIRDSGQGIPAEHKAKIFEPMFTTKERGTGLGLFIAREIIVAHGGTIGLESEGGRGTTFIITLPATVPVEPPLP